MSDRTPLAARERNLTLLKQRADVISLQLESVERFGQVCLVQAGTTEIMSLFIFFLYPSLCVASLSSKLTSL